MAINPHHLYLEVLGHFKLSHITQPHPLLSLIRVIHFDLHNLYPIHILPITVPIKPTQISPVSSTTTGSFHQPNLTLCHLLNAHTPSSTAQL
jgi:hypothetical protein